ncbi:MAG TPA: hypothetical protein VIP98_09260 [Microlunatus sp.]
MIAFLSGVVPAIISIAAAAIAMILVLLRSTGRARTTGTVGSVLLILSALTPLIYDTAMASRLIDVAVGGIYAVLLLQGILHTVLMVGGLLLLVWCVILTHRVPASSDPSGYGITGPPNPYGPTPYPAVGEQTGPPGYSPTDPRNS